MVHGEELGREAAELHLVARLDLDELRVLDLMLGELALDEAEGHLRAVDGHVAIEVLHEVREGSRVVLVAVRDDDAAQLVGVLQHVGVVGQDEVDARMVVIGEHEARVVQDHVALALEHGHVLADGIEPAERDDLERGVRVLLRRAEVGAARVLLAALPLLALPRLRELGTAMLELHVLVGARLLLVAARGALGAVAVAPAAAVAGLLLRTALGALVVLLFHKYLVFPVLRDRVRIDEEPGVR